VATTGSWRPSLEAKGDFEPDAAVGDAAAASGRDGHGQPEKRRAKISDRRAAVEAVEDIPYVGREFERVRALVVLVLTLTVADGITAPTGSATRP